MKKILLFFISVLLFHSTLFGQKYTFDREISGYTQNPLLINYNGLQSIAVDASANVYALSGNTYSIQKTTSTGQFISKWGTYGNDIGAFDALPIDIAIDKNTNSVYIITSSYIYKFSTDGVFIKKWMKNGSAAASYFSAIAVDASGNVYARDDYNGYIQIFNSSGDFISQWNVQKTNASYLTGMAFDASGNLHMTNYNGRCILKYSSSGIFLGQWGTAGTGPGELVGPTDICMDTNGNLYVTDFYSTIHKFSSAGTFIQDIGNQNYNTVGYVPNPGCIAIDASDNLYVRSSNGIQKFSNNISVTKWGQYDGAAQIISPGNVVVNSNQEISIITNLNVRIQKFSSAGMPLSAITVPQPPDYPDYIHVKLMEMDTDGNIYALINGYIKKFDENGVLLSQWTGSFGDVTDIALDNLGHIYMADNGDIKKYTLDGAFIKQWSLPNYAVVIGVAADAFGNVYAGNAKTRSIMKYNSQGTLLNAFNGSLGALTSEAQFISLGTLTLDASGNIYANNPDSNYVLKISPNGTLLARIGESGTGPGQVLRPVGVAIDLTGNVYVSDYGNDRIQIFKPYTSTPSSKIRVFSGDEEILLGGTYNMGVITNATTTSPFTIKNRNEATTALTLTEGLSLSNASAGFTLDQSTVSSPIAIGGNTSFSISYGSTNLTTPGVFTATVTIKNNDVDASTFTFNVIATIPAPLVSKIAVSAGSQIVAESTFDFGTINTDGAAFFTITNQSSATAPLTLTGTSPITLSNVNAGFTVNQTALTSPIAINGSTSFIIYFTRTSAMAAGQVSTMVSIANDDPTKNPFTFTVTATIPALPVSKIAVSQSTQQIAAGSTYNLGTVSTSSIALPFTITNQSTATAALTLTGASPITLSNTNAGFTVDQTTLNSPIAINGSTSFSISFTPTSAMASGQVSTTVSIANDDPTKNPFTFTVTATVNNTPTSILTTETAIFRVYPNPSNGNFTIHSSYDIQSITLINSIGQVQHMASKDITTDFRGIVVLEVVTTQGRSIQKLVIE